MATLVLGAAGAGIGAAFGNPMLGFQAGVIAGGLLFPQTQKQTRGKLDDLRVTGSGYGVMIPLLYGKYKSGGNVIWSTDLIEHVNTQGGGLGKGGAQQVTNYTYSISMAVAICEGPIPGFRRIWGQDILLYDSEANPPSQYTIRTYLGDEEQLPDTYMESIDGVGKVPAYRGTAFIMFENMPLDKWGGSIPQITVEKLDDPLQPLRVSDILDDLAQRGGMDQDDYEFEAAYDDVEGYGVMENQSCVDSMDSLFSIYGSDIASANGVVIAVRRGEPVVATILMKDLGAREDQTDDPPSLVETTRKSTTVLPQRLDLNYVSSDRAYDMGTQSGIKYDRTNPSETRAVSTGIVMKDIDARGQADRLLITEWLERDSHAIVVSPKFSNLCAASPINLEISGIIKRCRVIQIDEASLSVRSLTVVRDNTGGQATGVGTMGQPGRAAKTESKTILSLPTTPVYYFDIFAHQELRDEDGLSPGFYVATTFPNASVYYSLDDITYVFGGTVETASDLGTTTSVLSASGAAADTVDTTNTVDVILVANGPLTSTSAADVLSGSNACLIGDEIASYQTATATGVASYTLSNITRGRRGSAMSGHASGERFWHLTNSVMRIKLPNSAIGHTVYVKAVASGQDIADVTAKTVTIPANVYPYATPGEVSAAAPPLLTNGDIDGPTILFDDAVVIYASG